MVNHHFSAPFGEYVFFQAPSANPSVGDYNILPSYISGFFHKPVQRSRNPRQKTKKIRSRYIRKDGQ